MMVRNSLYKTLGLIAGVLVLFAYLRWPLWLDHSLYLYMGRCWWNGVLPYRDVLDQNWPGIIWISQLITYLTGATPLGVRVFDVVWQGASAYILFLIAIRMVSRTRALWAVFLYLALYLGGSYGSTAQREGFASLFLGLACLSLMPRRSDDITYLGPIWAGFACAAAIFIKPTLGIIPFLIGLFFVLRRFESQRRKWAAVGGLTVGCAAPFIVYGLYLLQTDTATDFVNACILYAAKYGSLSFTWFVKRMLVFLAAYPPGRLMVIFCLFLVGSLRYRRKWSLEFMLIMLFAVGSLGGLIVQRRLAYYHSMPFCYFAPLVVIAALDRKYALSQFLTRLSRRSIVESIVPVIVLSVLVLPVGFDLPRSVFSVLSNQSAAEYGDRCRVARGLPAWSLVERVMKVVDINADGDTRVLCLAGTPSPDFYFLSGRDPVYRHVQPIHMCFNPEFYEEALTTLSNDRQTKIVVLDSDRREEETKLFEIVTSGMHSRLLYEEDNGSDVAVSVYLVSNKELSSTGYPVDPTVE